MSAIVLILSLTACTFVNPEPPYGVWESNDPNIVMDIASNVDIQENEKVLSYKVIYTLENGDTKVLAAVFHHNRNFIEIVEVYEGNDGSVRMDRWFIGEYKTKGDKLTLRLTSQEFAKTTYEEIVFTRTKDYEEESKK